jgi:uncharacterized protein YrzB (UPF0473 family)
LRKKFQNLPFLRKSAGILDITVITFPENQSRTPCFFNEIRVQYGQTKRGGLSMSDEFGPTFVTITDDDGKELVLEYVASAEVSGNEYRAFFPAEAEDETVEEEDTGLIILKVVQEDGEELLSTCDSDEELDQAYDAFMEILFDEDEEEEKNT